MMKNTLGSIHKRTQPIDMGGWLAMNYMAGDQATWSEVRTACYIGSLAQFVGEFWP